VFYLELSGIGGYDHATRPCVAFAYPIGTPIEVGGDFHANVENFGGKVDCDPKKDAVTIYLSARDAADGFVDIHDDEAVGEYIHALASRGWMLHRIGKR